jgi:hypothetical protein
LGGQLVGRRQQADDDEGLAGKVEEVAGMDQHAVLLEQPHDERLLAVGPGHLHDRAPPALDRQHAARRMSGGQAA